MASLEPFGDRHGCTGDWEGHYAYAASVWSDRAFPIAATIVQRGRMIAGTMADGLTEWIRPLAETIAAHDCGPNPQPIPSLRGWLREYPWAISETVFPQFSDLRGRVRGNTVTLAKIYRGEITSRVRAGDTLLAVGRRPGPTVHYRGTLDWAGDAIEGAWRILFPGPFGRFVPPMAVGRFVLRRQRS